jgi:hypothetical protein
LGQQLLPFVRENYWNCASHGKFCANEIFKRAHKISKLRPHKRIFYAQINIKRPIYVVSTHNHAPEVARLIKTRGSRAVTRAYKRQALCVCKSHVRIKS